MFFHFTVGFTLVMVDMQFPHVGKQLITVTDELYPLSQPMAKFQSELQASGADFPLSKIIHV